LIIYYTILVTFGKFSSLPKNVDDAAKEGWTKNGDGCIGKQPEN